MEDNEATLAFPDTQLMGEQLWVSSALSVLRARHALHLSTTLSESYEEAIFALEGLAEHLAEFSHA